MHCNQPAAVQNGQCIIFLISILYSVICTKDTEHKRSSNVDSENPYLFLLFMGLEGISTLTVWLISFRELINQDSRIMWLSLT